MNPLFVGIDVSSKNNVAYLMKPDGSKHSSFSVQNNLGGAKLLSERIVSALGSMQLERVVLMNVSPRKLLQLRRSRIIPYSHIDRKVYYRRQDIIRYLENSIHHVTPESL